MLITPILWKSMATSSCLVTNIFQDVVFWVQQKKEIHTGLDQHDDKMLNWGELYLFKWRIAQFWMYFKVLVGYKHPCQHWAISMRQIAIGVHHFLHSHLTKNDSHLANVTEQSACRWDALGLSPVLMFHDLPVKHNDNLVQRALNHDGHLSHSRWWKHCAATAQTERWGPSCLTHTERDLFHHFSSWLSFKMESDSSCDPNSLPLLFFFLRFSLSLLMHTQISFTVSDSPTVLAGSGPDWRRKGGYLGQDWGPLPAETEKEQTVPLLPHAATPAFSYLTHVYTHARLLSGFNQQWWFWEAV